MATVTLGNIKFNWKGAWNSGTAYVIDDVVSLSGSSYVSIQAGTNQNPASASAYWQQMSAAGTNGTNGTDVGTTITTQGDLLYRDGSGLQRLAKGTAAQVLKMNTAANAPEWGTLSSDWVKIARTDITAVNSISFQDIFNNTDYLNYKIYIQQFGCNTAQGNLRYKWLTSGSTEDSTSTYWSWMDGAYFYFSNNSSGHSKDTQRDEAYGNLSPWGGYTNNTDHAGMNNIELTCLDPYRTKTNGSVWGGSTLIQMSYCYEGGSDNRYHVVETGSQFQKNETTKAGIKFYWSSGNFIASGTIAIYGMKA